jgi:hypothetical protein
MENGPFIDGLPTNSMVNFHGYVSHNQMVVNQMVAFSLPEGLGWAINLFHGDQ